jgi:hypothetical protein
MVWTVCMDKNSEIRDGCAVNFMGTHLVIETKGHNDSFMAYMNV